jgi:hypothetical protein
MHYARLHLTLHESIVAYTKQCVALEGPFTTNFITRAVRAAPDGASDTHGQIAHGYTSEGPTLCGLAQCDNLEK